MATLRELKGRIGSVASSEKITGAMKMISSAKMRKAEVALHKLSPFRTQIERIIGNLLCADATFTSPLSETRHVEKIAVVVFGSDDGLCGAYNVNVFKKLLEHLKEIKSDNNVDENCSVTVIPVGSKIAKIVAKLRQPNLKPLNFSNINSKSEGDSVRTFTKEIENTFLNGEYDRVDVVYMKFKSVSRQTAVSEQFLPVSSDTFAQENVSQNENKPYIFEPSAEEIYKSVIPLFLLSMMQEIFVENRASEQAARIMAMQSANDNAKKLLEQLQLEYNKLRQQSITTELLDIVGGQVR